MDVTVQVGQFFLISLCLGMTLFSLIVSTNLTGAGFYKVVLGVSAGAAACAWGSLLYTGLSFLSYETYLFGTFFLISAFEFLNHKDDRSKLIWILYFIKLIALCVLSYLFMGKNSWDTFFFVSSMGMLGSVTFTMVLGHWYLVTPRLTEKPLAVGLIWMWIIMAIKLVLTTYGYLEGEKFFTFSEDQIGMSYTFNWIMLSMRVLWGYLIILIMSYFTWKLVKMRSLQSATGILYVMTFFVFVGEGISAYLFYNMGLTI